MDLGRIILFVTSTRTVETRRDMLCYKVKGHKAKFHMAGFPARHETHKNYCLANKSAYINISVNTVCISMCITIE